MSMRHSDVIHEKFAALVNRLIKSEFGQNFTNFMFRTLVFNFLNLNSFIGE